MEAHIIVITQPTDKKNTGEDINSVIFKIERSYLSTSVFSTSDIVVAKGDSGATSYYIRIEDSEKCLEGIKNTTDLQ